MPDVCSPWNPLCALKEGAHAALGSAAQNVVDYWVEALNESLGNVMITLGSFWTKGTVGMDVGKGSPIEFMQQHMQFVVTTVLVASMMACGIQMLVTRSNDELQRLGRGVITTVIVSGAGTIAITVGVAAADAFSTWLMDAATEGQSASFGSVIMSTANIPSGGLFVVLVMGGAALIANIVQIGLLYLRAALLILVIAIFPVVAAASASKMGENWWRKLTGFVIAVILYKPVATIIYALGVRVLSSAAGKEDIADALTAYILGGIFLVAAALALPPLISFIMPVTAAIGGGGLGFAAAGAGAVASGAVNVRGNVGGSRAEGAGAAGGASSDLAKGAGSSAGAAKAGQAASGAAGAGTAASGAAAGATGGVSLVAQKAAEVAGKVKDEVSSSIEEETQATGAKA
ncbi:hypothetical protein [Kytococcus sedentarius]|uniref:hypothetical protein n=1 Tax=Kytococcus sedentarius TaxID=1276 RepID=UPI000AE7DAD7|nr:hypothetical protein [Kytococcus sedentarius]